MNLSHPTKEIIIDPTRALYKWARGWHHIQKKFFVEPVKLRREKQIEDFIILNQFKKIKFKIDTDIFTEFSAAERCGESSEADLVVITDQKFSRYPCPYLIEKIREQLNKCPQLYLCLNRRYINIDNSYIDTSLDQNFSVAITQWLKKSLPELDIIDMSLDVEEYGNQFTWAIPDRHYFIRKHNVKNN